MKRRWYQCLPGRFEPSIEEALASPDARRRNLAWIIMEEVGAARGLQVRFAERVGWSQQRVGHYLSGYRQVTSKAIDELAAKLRRDRADFERPEHPLGFPQRGAAPPLEPGDDGWETVWLFFRSRAPDVYESIDELRRRFPFYFPDGH